MGKIGKAANALRSENLLRRDEVVTNFMGGDSYKVNPLDTLKLITATKNTMFIRCFGIFPC